ncbi:MAG: hypothetical protein GY820_06860 [Gammaproteobacteria bacterium]|nr:hypothetical protein [Gammaproteobacteria bacterium]
MTKLRTPLTPTQSRWLQHVTAWESSGLSQTEFCQQQQLVYGTFVYWRHRLKDLDASSASSTVSFLPVTLSPVKAQSLMLRINGCHSIELDVDFDPVLLNRVVQALEQRR